MFIETPTDRRHREAMRRAHQARGETWRQVFARFVPGRH